MKMNILATSPNVQTCARNLDTRTLEMQIPVVAILMSRYAQQCTFRINKLYEFVDNENPYMRWLFNDEANIDWLKEYGILLHVEYSSRTGKRHEGARDIFDFIDDFRPPVGLEPKGFLNWATDGVINFSSDPDVHRAYRNFLCAKWAEMKPAPTWGDRMPPFWFVEWQADFGCPDKRFKEIGTTDDGKSIIMYNATAHTVAKSEGSLRVLPSE